MKKALVILIPLIIFLITAFVFRNDIANLSHQYTFYSPCDTVIKYSIGEIDNRFNLSREELLRRTRVAAKIWEDAYGKQLFQYDSSSPFTINAVYDERQELSTETQNLDGKLKQENTQINQNVAEFKAKVEAYKKKQEALNTDIQYWNGKGGAPENEYNSLKMRQEELQEEAKNLQAQAEFLNQSSDEFNSQAKALKETVNKFNDVLKVKPEGGIYLQNGNDKQITIYFNNSENEFVYTLAHEMGHSLGLPHNEDKESIMYPKVTEALIPSSSDLKSLSAACKERSIFDPYIQNIQRNLNGTSVYSSK